MHTLIFSLLLALMLLVASGAIWWGLMGRGLFMHEGKEQQAEAVALLREQREQLVSDFDTGLISEAERKDAEDEIELRVLEETAGQRSSPSNWRMSPLKASLILALAAGASVALYLAVGSPQMALIPAERHAGLMQSDGSVAAREAENDPMALEAFLADHPNNERVWVLLGRAYGERGNWSKAANAYEAGIRLKGKVSKDPQVLIEHAAALMSEGSERGYQKAADIIDRALLIDAGNFRAAELKAILSLQTENWKGARESLEFLMQALSPDDPMYRRFAEAASFAAQKEREADRAK